MHLPHHIPKSPSTHKRENHATYDLKYLIPLFLLPQINYRVMNTCTPLIFTTLTSNPKGVESNSNGDPVLTLQVK